MSELTEYQKGLLQGFFAGSDIVIQAWLSGEIEIERFISGFYKKMLDDPQSVLERVIKDPPGPLSECLSTCMKRLIQERANRDQDALG